jgi:hypothetical protein
MAHKLPRSTEVLWTEVLEFMDEVQFAVCYDYGAIIT